MKRIAEKEIRDKKEIRKLVNEYLRSKEEMIELLNIIDEFYKGYSKYERKDSVREKNKLERREKVINKKLYSYYKKYPEMKVWDREHRELAGSVIEEVTFDVTGKWPK